MIGGYEDIINLTAPTSQRHPRMSISQRAAQFSPFAALVGYSEAIKESSRLTDTKPQIDEEQKQQINQVLLEARDNKDKEYEITYFIKDPKKEGGKIQSFVCSIVKVDEMAKVVVLSNLQKVPIVDIVDLK